MRKMTVLPREHVSRMCAAVVEDCACEGLRRAARAVSKLYEGALAPLNLTASQLAILVATRLRGRVPLSRLAVGLALDRTSLYRAVRPLERRGYLRLVAGRTRRERMAAVTASGEHLLRQALPIWETTQRRFLAAVGTRTWAALSSALAQVVPIARTIHSEAAARGRRRRQTRARPRLPRG
jgi:DNA-binding MarR family transcriptional regulator